MACPKSNYNVTVPFFAEEHCRNNSSIPVADGGLNDVQPATHVVLRIVVDYQLRSEGAAGGHDDHPERNHANCKPFDHGRTVVAWRRTSAQQDGACQATSIV